METQETGNVVRNRRLLKQAKERSGLSLETLEKSLQAILSVISENIKEGNEVKLDNFGRFKSSVVKEHTAIMGFRNNEEVIVPEQIVVRFKAYKQFMYYFMR